MNSLWSLIPTENSNILSNLHTPFYNGFKLLQERLKLKSIILLMLENGYNVKKIIGEFVLANHCN